MSQHSSIPWEPAVYEHKAALIGATVAEVSRSAELLIQAMLAEYATYCADAITVGIDVYNVEAEACGACVRELGDQAVPDVQTLWSLDALPDSWPDVDVARDGRFDMFLKAGQSARRQLPDGVRVRMAASGPLSLACKLVGFDDVLMAVALEDAALDRLLDFTTALCLRWCRRVRDAGLDVMLFDSAAAPPMLGADQYRRVVRPRHQELMEMLAASGQVDRPLIIGGDTTTLVADMAAAGATQIICDFPAPAEAFAHAVGDRNLVVRRNVDPRLLLDRTEDVSRLAQKMVADVKAFAHPVIGTGVLAYDVPPHRVVDFRDAVRRCLGV